MDSPFLFTVDDYSFMLEWDEQFKTLDIARYLFLRDDGDKLKESYVRYLVAFNLGGREVDKLSQRSWRRMDRNLWLSASMISEVQSRLNESAVSGEFSVYVVKGAYDGIRRSVGSVARVSRMAMFEGKEYLLEHALRDADDVIDRLGVELVRYKLDTELGKPCDFAPIGEPIKSVAVISGNLLKSLCKIADEITIQ